MVSTSQFFLAVGGVGVGYTLALGFQVPLKRRRESDTVLPLVALAELEGIAMAYSWLFPVTRKRNTVSTLLPLPLLTLAGVGVGVIIASFPVLLKRYSVVALFQKRKRVRDFDSFVQENSCPKENYITRLPDEIMCHIISYLGINDAVRTSVLSRRWRKLYCTLPNPKFECHKMFEFVSLTEHDFHRKRFVTAVDTFLRLRSGLPMESFTLRFDLMRKFPGHLRSWMNCIVRSGVRNLHLHFCRNDKLFKIPDSELTVLPFKVLLSACMLEYVQLSFCILEPNFQGPSNSLKELSLCFVPLVNGEVESILLSCPQLRSLHLTYCKLPYKLLVNAVELRNLKISCCEQVREIGFSAPNLDIFLYSGNFGVSFLPSYVPNLRKLFLDVMRHDRPPQGLVGFVQEAPCLHTILVQAPPYQVRYLQREMPRLRNLHTLSLNVVKESLDLRDIISLMAICPNLSTFEFSSLLCLLSYRERDEEVLPTCVHLKHVVLDGYKFEAAQQKFASQLLKCAPALEKMSIYTAYCLFHLGQDVEKTLPLDRSVFSNELIRRTKEQLEQHASSSSTLVSISCTK